MRSMSSIGVCAEDRRGRGKSLVSQPDNGSMALEIAETADSLRRVDIVVVEGSVAALVPKAESRKATLERPANGFAGALDVASAAAKLTGSFRSRAPA